MTQEEKQLLRKELYTRQYYGVKVSLGLDRMSEYIEPEVENNLTLYYINPQRLECVFKECWWTAYIGAIRPYLRPMSSMTEEEEKEYFGFYFYEKNVFANTLGAFKLMDWLNEHYFDYRGLIEKGLALKAPEGMYNTKTE